MHLVQSMAYTGAEPWHGLGSKLAPKQSLEVWRRAAGMDWRIEEAEVRFVAAGNRSLGSIHAFPEQKVLYRLDNKAPLSVVSARYQVVQPKKILEFYRDLTEIGGFQFETAGVLKEGRKLWALAKTGHSGTLRGKDEVNGYHVKRKRAAVQSEGNGTERTGGRPANGDGRAAHESALTDDAIDF